MSGTASVPNSFAAAVTATGAQLDANYSTIVAYINDPTNRNNFAVDSGTTNTVVLSFTPAVIGGYTTGLEITFKAAATNAGAVVLNANGLGNKNLLNSDGTALSSGQITVGATYKAVYDGTAFLGIGLSGGGGAATQAQMEAASATNVFVTPGRQQFHPSAPKAWVNCALSGTNITSTVGYNIASVVRTGTGAFTITFSTPFSSNQYGMIAGLVGDYSSGQSPRIMWVNSAFAPSTASIGVVTGVSSAAGEDPVRFSAMFMGDQP